MSLFTIEEVQRRVEALEEYDIMDTLPEKAFDHLAELVASICETPISTITLLDERRQWFKSRVGLAIRETPIEHSFCAHAVAQKTTLIVPDATLDERFAQNPFVKDEPEVRFYVGTPLINAAGIAVGAICAIDQVPRELDPHQLVCLKLLATKTIELLEKRKKKDTTSSIGGHVAISSHQKANARMTKTIALIRGASEVVTDTSDPDTMIMGVMNIICRHTGWSVGHMWLPKNKALGLDMSEHTWRWGSTAETDMYRNYMENNSQSSESGLLQQCMDQSALVAQPCFEDDIHCVHAQLLHRLGFKGGIATPLIGDELIGAIEFYQSSVGIPDRDYTDSLTFIGHLLAKSLEREAGRRKIQKSEAYFRHLTEDSLDLISILDANGFIRFESRSAKDDLGWEPEELVGRNAFEFVHPDDAPDAMAAFQESLRSEGPTPLLVFRFLHKDGSYRILEGRGNNLLADPAVSGIVFTSRDITEKKHLETQFGELAGGIAHDFNNLLTIVVGYSSAVETDSGIDPKLRDALNEIRTAAERAAGLTNQLLAFSGRQILQPRNLLLDAKLSESQNSLTVLLEENIALAFTPGAPLACIHADSTQLDTVLWNLALNAREAGADFIQLSTEIATITAQTPLIDLPPGEYALIKMQDNGHGMSAEIRRRIFDPYFTTKTRGKGTGLGLATCQGIIRQSHGTITVTSEPHSGSTFSIYLPAVENPVATPILPTVPTEQKDRIRTILFAEDEEAIRDLGNIVLESTGYRLLSAANGRAALDLLDANPDLTIDLVLTDIMMPGMNGKELAEIIRQRMPTVPIIFCSGYAQDSSFYEGLPTGTQLLAKPYTVSALLQIVSECLSQTPQP